MRAFRRPPDEEATRLTALSPWRYWLLVGGAVVLLVLIACTVSARYIFETYRDRQPGVRLRKGSAE
jgi:hypothetical protein